MVKEVPLPEEGLIESGSSEKGEGRFSKVDERCFALRRNNVEVHLDVDFVQADDDWIGFHPKWWEGVIVREKDIKIIFDETSNSKFRKSSTEDVEKKLEDSFGYDRENIAELKSEVGFRLGVIAEIDGSTILFCRQMLKV